MGFRWILPRCSWVPGGWLLPKFIANWLVVLTVLKNISQLGWLFPIYGKIKNSPNHQPTNITKSYTFLSLDLICDQQYLYTLKVQFFGSPSIFSCRHETIYKLNVHSPNKVWSRIIGFPTWGVAPNHSKTMTTMVTWGFFITRHLASDELRHGIHPVFVTHKGFHLVVTHLPPLFLGLPCDKKRNR
jgi:hypothetical protein